MTLGEVTLDALFDRVLSTAAETYPFLASVSLEADGLRCEGLREKAKDIPREELLAALRFVLLELLTVVGNLTAEILSPALHDALSRVPTGAASDDSTAPQGPWVEKGRES